MTEERNERGEDLERRRKRLTLMSSNPETTREERQGTRNEREEGKRGVRRDLENIGLD